MATYSFGIVAFEDMSVNQGNPLTTNHTQRASGTFTVNDNASPIRIYVNDVDEDRDGNPVPDSDTTFDDAYIDTGAPQLLAEPVTINGQLFEKDSVVELEFRVNTTTGENFYFVRIDGVNIGMGGTVLPQPGTTYTLDDSFDGQRDAFEDLACFTAGTLIDTPDGPKPVESLTVGTEVLTRDNGVQKVVWQGQRTLDLEELKANPRFLPVHIGANALGEHEALTVSPQHRVLVGGWRAELLFAHAEVLVAAKALIDGVGVTQPEATGPVTYVHLLFKSHEVISSGGLWSESFDPAAQNVEGLARDARAELFALFPELDGQLGDLPTAYPVVRTTHAHLLSAA
ncbi:Hint domain-containing protein [Celeribacter arenosi]|uniref:Hedgehog/Intein (Hint) domain-containing protein n=1 Tax=Celeribacter arenosi TaxID=792649 RepID=A0ABP7KDH0_9RHOB